jgi:hypothetical protein
VKERYDPEVYSSREWFESLKWQHMWIEYLVGWWIGEFGRPKNVIDFGAGDGWWCKAFHDFGAEAYAVELHEVAKEFIHPAVHFVQRDLREPISDGGLSDLVICLEVAEHLPKEHADTLCETLTCHTGNLLLFSAAGPGQPGTGHVHLQSQEYWQGRIERLNKIQYSEVRSERVRQAFANIVPEGFRFLPDNVQVFARV